MYNEEETELNNRIAYCESLERHVRPNVAQNECTYCYRTLIPPLKGLGQEEKSTRNHNDFKRGLEEIAKAHSVIN